ncbi:hypothetical protein [Burkholderia sola]|uniref:hypothetical protein n=1 Tax=Burkholderia sola TaxID=2843302 RepID=UPI00338E813F
MAKILISRDVLEGLSLKLQQISVLFDAIDDDIAKEVRTSVICSIGLDIAARAGDKIATLITASHAEGRHA